MDDGLFQISLKLIIQHQRRVFALQRWSHQGDLFWDLPGGRLQLGETDSLKCIRRELDAELGYQQPLTDQQLRVVDFNVWPGADEYPAKGIVYYHAQLQLDFSRIRLSSEHAGFAELSLLELQSQDSLLKGARLEPELRTVLLGALQ